MKRSVLMLCVGLAACSAEGVGLAPSWVATGHVRGELAAAANANFNGNMTVTLGTIPVGAIVQKAFLYASEWNSNFNASASLAGNNLGMTTPFASDAGLTAFRWDVTGIVGALGSTSYSVSITGPQQLFGCALAVVYTHPTLPNRTVQLNDGAIALADFGGPETGSTPFQGFGAGSGTLSIYTQGDDGNATGETVKLNGNTVGGPLDANLGATASLLNLNVTTVAGTNTASITSPSDVLGWHVAMLQGPQPVPEPATFLLAAGALSLAARRRWRRAGE